MQPVTHITPVDSNFNVLSNAHSHLEIRQHTPASPSWLTVAALNSGTYLVLRQWNPHVTKPFSITSLLGCTRTRAALQIPGHGAHGSAWHTYASAPRDSAAWHIFLPVFASLVCCTIASGQLPNLPTLRSHFCPAFMRACETLQAPLIVIRNTL